jgi:GTP-binding protein Era
VRSPITGGNPRSRLQGVENELPHSIMVVVEEMGLCEGRPADQPLLHIYASMIVSEIPRKAS